MSVAQDAPEKAGPTTMMLHGEPHTGGTPRLPNSDLLGSAAHGTPIFVDIRNTCPVLPRNLTMKTAGKNFSQVTAY